MIVSAARKLASQTNGSKSKGPITPEGKAVSRANSFKHGLTGAGVVVPEEDAAEVAHRFDALQKQFNPATPMGQILILVHRVAFLSVRLERSARQEAAFLGEKIRHAREDHDEECQSEVDRLLADLAHQPSLSVRKLLRTPEGIDALMMSWEGLKDDLNRPTLNHWTARHDALAHHLTGRRVEDIPISRIHELSTAIWGDFGLLRNQEGEGLDIDDRRAWARDLLIELINEELNVLKICREGLDLEGFEQDREEAGQRALFDLSKAAILARRYEAAAERGMFRALKELRQVEEAATEAPQVSPSCPGVPLGSFGKADQGQSEPDVAWWEQVSDADLTTVLGSNRAEIDPISIDFGGRGGVKSRISTT